MEPACFSGAILVEWKMVVKGRETIVYGAVVRVCEVCCVSVREWAGGGGGEGGKRTGSRKANSERRSKKKSCRRRLDA